MSADEIAYWDNEAIDDPRYATAAWGMNGLEDGEHTINRILARLIAGMGLSPGRVLEIGCGPCRLLLRLAQLYPHGQFYGVDISGEMLWIADQRIAASAARNIIVGHAAWSARNMDLVYCVELMQHLDDGAASETLLIAWNALKPGGTFIAQFVARGEPGPHSFPRDEEHIRSLYDWGVWGPLTIVQDVHEDWLWVSTVKR